MPARSYAQFCGLARALDLVGERWALLVIRELLLGPRRFTDLLEGLPGIGTNVLTARLKELEAAGIVTRRVLPPPAASKVYELTEYGREIEPALVKLGLWGSKTLERPDPTHIFFRPEWTAIAFRAIFEPDQARGLHALVEFHLNETSLYFRIDDGTLEITTTPPGEPDVRIATDLETYYAWRRGAMTTADAIGAGRLHLDGDPELI